MGYWKLVCSWGLSYCAISCAVSAITAPILSYSGIPLALLAPVGTLIFTPLVMAILAVSGLLWCMLFCGMPGTFLCVSALEALSFLWYWLLSCAPHGYCIPLPAVPTTMVAPLVISVCALSIWIQRYSTLTRISMYCVCIATIYLIGWSYIPAQQRIALTRSGGIAYCHAYPFSAIIDTGTCRVYNPDKWAQYHVARTLARSGRCSVDALIIHRATQSALERARILARNHCINAVIIYASKLSSKKLAQFASEMAACSIACIIDDLP